MKGNKKVRINRVRNNNRVIINSDYLLVQISIQITNDKINGSIIKGYILYVYEYIILRTFEYELAEYELTEYVLTEYDSIHFVLLGRII